MAGAGVSANSSPPHKNQAVKNDIYFIPLIGCVYAWRFTVLGKK
jgi:hypothetical protein